MTPRKHAELIKAWADGAEIQVKSPNCDHWYDVDEPGFHTHQEYRIKPVPKADVVEEGVAYFANIAHGIRVRMTFSGETGEPKNVGIVK